VVYVGKLVWLFLCFVMKNAIDIYGVATIGVDNIQVRF